jgi:3-phenylpropionate/trans-cinnamate dioxygenase ferredoxin subunit
MAEWTRVASVSEIPDGEFKTVEFDGSMAVVFNLNGEFYALADLCTHDGGPLSDGIVLGEEVVCPRHGARFAIRTGAVTAPPAEEPVHRFPVRVRGDDIELRDDRDE